MRILLAIAAFFGAGYMAWNVSKPKDFGDAIGFVIIWAIFAIGSILILNAITPDPK